ncbi:MAG TPA: noncanonical pyrimidine nucleotidase, YjjG family [Bacteroidetes bacterium]|nr:noncanonical pyrimidine nucleotidase, YjjG family [Bacteroidota bacterium]
MRKDGRPEAEGGGLFAAKMNLKYQHIFFDLDHTLWDFETNSFHSLQDLFKMFSLADFVPDEKTFIDRYHFHNDIYWDQFRKGEITREVLRAVRFRTTLAEFGIVNEELVKQLSVSYLEILPTKTFLFHDTIDVLEYLKKKYSLHIITNGFEEVQFKKIRNTDIEKYFHHIITSEAAGSQKPEAAIFKYAMQLTNASVLKSIFIGDSIEADINGAKAVGMDYAYYNPKKTPHEEKLMKEIFSLSELKEFL